MTINAAFDADGYITNWSKYGTVEQGIDVDAPEDINGDTSAAYRIVCGAVVLDEERLAAIMAAMGDEDEQSAQPDQEDRISTLESNVDTLTEVVNILLGVSE